MEELLDRLCRQLVQSLGTYANTVRRYAGEQSQIVAARFTDTGAPVPCYTDQGNEAKTRRVLRFAGAVPRLEQPELPEFLCKSAITANWEGESRSQLTGCSATVSVDTSIASKRLEKFALCRAFSDHGWDAPSQIYFILRRKADVFVTVRRVPM